MTARAFEPVGHDVFCLADTCNVYAVRTGDRAVLVDFGRGRALDHLAEIGVKHVDAVLVTHAHRDQVQGLQRAVDHGIEVFVPPLERELVRDADAHWAARQLANDYDLRQDKFSLLHGVAIVGWVKEYTWQDFGGLSVFALPTPGHTVGSVSYLVQREGDILAFTGDLIYGPGQVWSLAATQWSYTGVEGLVATMASCHEIGRRQPGVLFPSHGAPLRSPPPALDLVQHRLAALVDNRVEVPWAVSDWYREPWVAMSPHLLRNRASMAISYALISDSGNALVIDFGYDICPGMLVQSDRQARRPLLTSLGQLRERFGVERVEVAVPTHYHDDHVAGFNLLRETAGTEVWALADIAGVLETPTRDDLPCLWHDPIPVQRALAPGTGVRWREYELTLFPLPGHTLYACAILFEVDGRRVLATGDQQTGTAGGRREVLNFQYRNRFGIDDYVHSAELYQRLRPNLMISGHWAPMEVTDGYLEMLSQKGRELARHHRELLPLEEVDFGAGGFGARIEPYRSDLVEGERVTLVVTVKNPFNRAETARVEMVVPSGWSVAPARHELEMSALAETEVSFVLGPARGPAYRARVAAELKVGERDFGQQAEALVSVR